MTTATENLPVEAKSMTPEQRKTNTVRTMLEQFKDQIAMALPRHLTPERMIRAACTTLIRTPALLDCSALSLCGCVIQASELGLELSGPLGQAYMVPYWNKNTKQNEAQFQVGYRGLMDLAYRSGQVEHFAAHCVYRNDSFRFVYGTRPALEHMPSMASGGELIWVYAILKLKGGGFDFEVMSKAQIDAHRDRYSKAKGENSPWNTAYEEMAKKTVIRRLAKRAPVSVELRTAAILDEYGEAGVPQNLGREFQGTIPVITSLPEPQPEPGKKSRSEKLAEKLGGKTNGAEPAEPVSAMEGQLRQAIEHDREGLLESIRNEGRRLGYTEETWRAVFKAKKIKNLDALDIEQAKEMLTALQEEPEREAGQEG